MSQAHPSVAPSAVGQTAIRNRLFQLIAIMLAGGAANFALFAVGPLQETMRIALGLTDNQIALLQGPALYLPPLLVGFPLGLLIDRFPRARLLALFTAIEVLGTVLTALAPSFTVILLARALIGSMQCANAMNASALIVEWVQPHRRGRTLMLLGVVQMASVSAVFSLGGELLVLFDAGPSTWRWAMLGLAVPLGLIFLLTLWVRDLPRRADAPSTLAWRAALAALWRYRMMLVPLSFGQVIVTLGYTASTVWSQPIFARQFHLSPNRIGAIMGVVLLVSGLLGNFLGGILVDGCQRAGGPRRAVSLLIVLALAQVPAGVFGVMPSVFLVSLLLVALCTIGNMKGVVCTTIMSSVVPKQFLGSSFGALVAISSVFSSIAPLAVSTLAGRIGGIAGIGQALTIVCIVTSVAGAATFAAGRRHFPGRSGMDFRVE